MYASEMTPADIRACTGGNEDGFGGGGAWWIIILLLFGWGRGGFGGGGFGGSAAATQADIASGFNNSAILSGINDLSRELASCCCETQRSIDGVNFNLAKGFCDIGNVIQMSTRDVIENQNANSRAILDFLVKDKIETLTAENQSLRFAASQAAQNQFITQVGSDIVNRLNPPAVPAYQVPNPYTGGYGYNAGCGCGCGCGYNG